MGRNQTRSTWSMPIAFPQGGIQTYIADYISHQQKCDGVCILWISPWGKCKSRWLHACPPQAEIPKCTSEMLISMPVNSKHSQHTANSKLSLQVGEQVTCVAIMLECVDSVQGELPIFMCVWIMSLRGEVQIYMYDSRTS